MSTRKPVQHPEQRKKHDKTHSKMPTNDKQFKLMNRLKDLDDKKSQIASNIVSRNQFLHNTMINNKKNEANRILGILQYGPMAFANDGRFRRVPLTQSQTNMLGQRGANLLNDIRTMTPIIGQQGRFMFV
jgi:hypothetical protein